MKSPQKGPFLIIPVCTMYAVKISGTHTFFGFVYSDKIPVKFSQNNNLTTSFVWLLCQQSKSSNNIYVAFDRPILHTLYHAIHYVPTVVIPYTCTCSLPLPDKLFFKDLFMKCNGL